MLVSSAVLNFISVYYHLLFTPLFCIYCIIALCFRLGAAFCPLIPALSVMKLFLYFYIKKVCNSINFNEVDFISSYQVHSCSFLKHNIVDILMYIPRFRIHNNDEFTFNGIDRERSRRFDSFAISSSVLWFRSPMTALERIVSIQNWWLYEKRLLRRLYFASEIFISKADLQTVYINCVKQWKNDHVKQS